MTIILTVHPWRWPNWHHNGSTRTCFGLFSLTYIPHDMDEQIDLMLEYEAEEQP